MCLEHEEAENGNGREGGRGLGAQLTVSTSTQHRQEVKRVTDSSSEENGEEEEEEEKEEDSDGNHQKNGGDSGQGQNHGARVAVPLHSSTPSSHHQPASSTILLSPVSFQHSHLRTKSFPPPPLIRPPPTLPKIHAPVPSDAASVHASAADADADASSAHDGGVRIAGLILQARRVRCSALLCDYLPSKIVILLRVIQLDKGRVRCSALLLFGSADHAGAAAVWQHRPRER